MAGRSQQNGDFIINIGSNVSEVISDFTRAVSLAQNLQRMAKESSAELDRVANKFPQSYRGGMGAAPSHVTIEGITALTSAINQLREIIMTRGMGGPSAGIGAHLFPGQITNQERMQSIRLSDNVSSGGIARVEVAKALAEVKMATTKSIAETNLMYKEIAQEKRKAYQAEMRSIRESVAETKKQGGMWRMEQTGAYMTGKGGVLMDPTGKTPIRIADVDAAQRQMSARDQKSSILETVTQRAVMYGGISLGLYKAVGAANEFLGKMIEIDREVGELKKTLAGTDVDFENLVNSAVDIARKYKAGTAEVLNAMELFSQQFKKQKDLELLAGKAIMFSNLSGQSLKESAEVITATIQQYNMAVSDSTKITDSWAAISASTAVTTKDLGDAVSVAGGAAKQAGISFDKFNGMVAAVSASTGKSGKEVGSGFTRIFERMTSDEGIKNLDKVGVHVKDIKGQFRPLGDVLDDVSDKWSGLSATQQKQVAIASAGARQYSIFLALMNNYSKAVNLAAISHNSLGAAQMQNEKIAETFTKKLQGLSVEFDKLAASGSRVVIPVLGNIVTVMSKLLGQFNDAPASVKLFGTALAGLTAANVLGSFAFKALGTSWTAEKGRFVNPNSQIANAIGGDVLDTNGNVSLLRGGLKAAGRGIGGAGASVLGGLGMAQGAGSFAALATGIGLVIAALGVMYYIVKKVTESYEAMRDKLPDFLKNDSENTSKTAQMVSNLMQDSRRVGETISTDPLTGKKSFNGDSANGIVKDVLRNNPEIISKAGIYFDRFGDAMNLTVPKLEALEAALADAAETAQAFSYKVSAENARGKATEFGRNTRDGNFVDRWMLGLDNPDAVGTGSAMDILGRGGKNAGTNLRVIAKKLQKAGFNVNDTFDESKYSELNGGVFGPAGLNNFNEASTVISSLKEAANIKASNNAAYLPEFMKIFKSPRKKGETEKQAQARRLKLAQEYKIRESANLTNTAPEETRSLLGLDVPEFFQPGPRTEGVNSSGSGKIKGFRARVVPRIDLELQKSLQDSQINAKNFGADEIDTATEALAAYKKAITELGTDIDKAAGPTEEPQFVARQERMKALKDRISSLSKGKPEDSTIPGLGGQIDKDLADPNRKQLAIKLADELFRQEEDYKYAIQEENAERKKGLDILKAQYGMLEMIVRNSNILKGAIGATLQSIPSDMRENILGNRQAGADKDFLQQQMDREKGLSNPNSAGTVAYDNYEVNRRNNLKHINEQVDSINRSMDALNEKTNIWGNLLRHIGDAYISEISSKLAKGLINTVNGDSIAGIAGQSLYGDKNKGFDIGQGGVLAGGGMLGVGALMAANSKNAGSKADASHPEATNQYSTSIGPVNNPAYYGNNQVGSANQTIDPTTMKTIGTYVSAALVGAGAGSSITNARGKTGYGGAIGGAAGAVVGTTFFGAEGGSVWGPLLGGLIGSMFDKDIEPLKKTLDELTNTDKQLNYNLTTMNRGLNTINQTMENIINAPANFTMPIPKGVLENSITAQSAIATPLQAGGLIVRSGPIYAHAGETIGKGLGKGSTMNNVSFTINGGNNDPQAIANEVMQRLNSSVFDQSQRVGNYKSRF